MTACPVAHGKLAEHFVQFYEDDQVLVRSIADFIEEGLALGEGALIVATESHRSGVEVELETRGLKVKDLVASNQLLAVDAAATLASFSVKGEIHEGRFRKIVGEMLGRIRKGRPGVRIFGEMVALLDNSVDAIRLEEFWNRLPGQSENSLFCAYPIRAFQESAGEAHFVEVCCRHSRVVPVETYRTQDPAVENLRSIALLQRRAAALEAEVASRQRVERALQEKGRTLTILHNVASALLGANDLESILRIATDAGRDLARAAYGAYIQREGSQFVIETQSGVSKDWSLPLSPILTRPTFSQRRIVRIDDINVNAKEPHSSGDFRSYLAVPVVSSGGYVLGALVCADPEIGAFTPDSEQVLTTLAAQMAVALDNAGLAEALRKELAATMAVELDSRRLAAIVESSEDAIIGKDLNGIIMSWNESAQRIFGYRPEEIIGKSVTLLIPDDHIDEEPNIVARIRAGKRIEHYETVRRRKDGSLIDIALTVSPIRDSTGTIIGASKIVRDITAQKRDEEALRAATLELQKSRDELELRVAERTAALREAISQMEEFSYTVSHDLRAPLRAMNAYSVALLEDYGDLLKPQPEAVHHLERIAANCRRLDKMVSEILAYGRIAREDVQVQPIALDQLVRDVAQNYPTLQKPLAEVTIESLASVIGHEPSLIQAISNLLTNAAKFVKPGRTPVIRVWTELIGDQVRLWVQDNGIGIEPSQQKRLFTMFERVHPRLEYEGTGVGLAIVRKALERMGGRVGVESDGMSGSRFWIELPGVSTD